MKNVHFCLQNEFFYLWTKPVGWFMAAPKTSQGMLFCGNGLSDDNGCGQKSIYLLSGIQQLTGKTTPKPLSFTSGSIVCLTALSALCWHLDFFFFPIVYLTVK